MHQGAEEAETDVAEEREEAEKVVGNRDTQGTFYFYFYVNLTSVAAYLMLFLLVSNENTLYVKNLYNFPCPINFLASRIIVLCF